MKYEAIVPACDLCLLALEMAAQKLGPAFVYDLYINPKQIVWVKGMLKINCMDIKDNVLAPYINLFEDSRLNSNEWYLCANNKAVGADGP